MELTNGSTKPGLQTISGIFVRHILILVGVNLILRALWLVFMHPPQALDFDWYYTHAVQMATGYGYRQGTQFTAYWPIGYPYFLSLLFRITGPSVIAGLLANACMSTTVVALIYALTSKLTNRPGIAFLAAAGYTVLPSQIEWNSVLGSEELFTVLLLLFLLIYVVSMAKRLWWMGVLCAGILLGLACDVRPIPLLFPCVVWIYELWIRRSKFARSTLVAVLMFVGMGIGICPVTIRNAVVLHHFVLVSTNGGVNLWQGTMTDGAYFWSWDRKVNPLLAAGADQILEGNIGTHVFVQHVLHHPLWTVVHGVFKWFFLYWADWNVVGVTFAAFTKKPIGWLVSVAMWFDTVVYWLWMVVCAIGWVKGIRRKRMVASWKVIALPLAYIGYNTAIFFFFPAWDRFRYPMMPLFAVLFGFGLHALYGDFRARRTRASMDNHPAPVVVK